MPKRHQVIKSVKKTDPLVLPCEWSTCSEIFSDMFSYTEHIGTHGKTYLEHVKSSKQNGQQGEDEGSLEDSVTCYWRGCLPGNAMDTDTFFRHLHFHAFHTKIKCVGSSLAKLNDFAACYMDPEQANVIPDLPDKLSCGWEFCTEVFENPEYFYLHIANHCEVYPYGNNVEGGCECQWEGCATVTKSKHKLKEHMRSHSQEKVVACPTCGALFSNMSKFFDHIKRQVDTSVTGGTTYKCSHCNKNYATERLLKDHMRRHVNYYQCPFCDMTCPNPSNLRQHFRYRHSDSRPYICTKCNHTSKTKGDLTRHMDTHDNWIYCTWDSCDYRCHSLSELNRHSRLTHDAPTTAKESRIRFLCHLCSVTYTKSVTLTYHLRKKHKFRWPPGHVRFRYTYREDGFYRLQTVRYESLELMHLPATATDGSLLSPGTEEVTTSETPVEEGTTTTDNVHDDVYEDIQIPEGEESAKAGNNYSYNLDLLGNVALNDSLMEDEQRAEESVNNVKRSDKGEKRKRKSNGKGRKSSAKKKQRKDSSSKSIQMHEILPPQNGNEEVVFQDIGESPNVVDLHIPGKDDAASGDDSEDLVQTITLPSGEEVLITSNIPIHFAEPISIEEEAGGEAIPLEQAKAQLIDMPPPKELSPTKGGRRFRPTLEEKIQELVASKTVPDTESLYSVEFSPGINSDSMSGSLLQDDSLDLDIRRELHAAVNELDL